MNQILIPKWITKKAKFNNKLKKIQFKNKE